MANSVGSAASSQQVPNTFKSILCPYFHRRFATQPVDPLVTLPPEERVARLLDDPEKLRELRQQRAERKAERQQQSKGRYWSMRI